MNFFVNIIFKSAVTYVCLPTAWATGLAARVLVCPYMAVGLLNRKHGPPVHVAEYHVHQTFTNVAIFVYGTVPSVSASFFVSVVIFRVQYCVSCRLVVLLVLILILAYLKNPFPVYYNILSHSPCCAHTFPRSPLCILLCTHSVGKIISCPTFGGSRRSWLLQ